MKKLLLILAVLTFAVAGCQEEKPAAVRFCADIRPNNPCIGEDTVFLHGTNVWAQLLLNPEFDGTSVTGNLYGYQDGKRVFIESKVHELSEGQEIVMEAIFLNNCGEFEVEFLDSRGNLLAKGGFEIW
ncbi:MAG: hypothetical protein R6U58_01140 [Bacteroidales bacterium]